MANTKADRISRKRRYYNNSKEENNIPWKKRTYSRYDGEDCIYRFMTYGFLVDEPDTFVDYSNRIKAKKLIKAGVIKQEKEHDFHGMVNLRVELYNILKKQPDDVIENIKATALKVAEDFKYYVDEGILYFVMKDLTGERDENFEDYLAKKQEILKHQRGLVFSFMLDRII